MTCNAYAVLLQTYLDVFDSHILLVYDILRSLILTDPALNTVTW